MFLNEQVTELLFGFTIGTCKGRGGIGGQDLGQSVWHWLGVGFLYVYNRY
jgi:hypothetical protein